MARTRCSGITVDDEGNRVVAKQFKGKTIFARLGQVSQEFAEEFLAKEIAKIRREVQLGERPSRVFAAAAQRYLTEAATRVRRLDELTWHVGMLLPYIGTKPLEEIHNGSFDRFRTARYADGVSPTTINRTLEVARTILNNCATLYRDEVAGKVHPWLKVAPKIVMEKENRRKPHPLTWEEQARLMPQLPDHLARMVLFNLNTGAREEEICALEWSWEREIEGTAIRVFVIPEEVAKNGHERVLVVNDVARSVVEQCRGMHERYVFVYVPRQRVKPLKPGERAKPARKPHRVERMNNHAFRKARERAQIDCTVHDLRHTFGRRLRAAGVSEEDRADLLGHWRGSVTTHYSAAELSNLIEAANKVNDRRHGGVLKVVSEKSLAEVLQAKRKAS